jgi:hypothetical protein
MHRRAFQISNGDDIMVLWIIEWSDDFDPNDSIKANRGGVWIKTVTICAPISNTRSITNTYCIAIGKKGVSHEAVEVKFKEELLKLSSDKEKWYYHGKENTMVRVHAELFASLMDQPERRDNNCLMRGNSIFHARFGHSGDLTSVSSKIPACDSCLKLLASPESYQQKTKNDCTKCANWDTNTHNGVLDFDPPTDFPESKLPNNSRKLGPFKITYDMLKEAVSETHNNIVSGEWDKKTGAAYLRIFSINTESATCVIDNASRKHEFDLAESKKDEFPETYKWFKMDMEKNPDYYCQWKIPAFWEREVELSQFVDAVMHLCFLGVFKNTIKMTKEWLKCQQKHPSFLRFAEGMLDPLQSMNLSWCNVLNFYDGNFSGWVSENHLALARLSKWFYSGIRLLKKEKDFVEPPVRVQLWYKADCEKWLKLRGLDSEGKKDELVKRIEELKNSHDGPPPVLPPKGGSIDNLENVFQSMLSMLSHIMAAEIDEDHILEVERHVKLFLSMFDKFDSCMRGEKDTPTWITSFNYICLLNIADAMREFGPMRNLWEGGSQGEAFLRVVKPQTTAANSVGRKNWQVNLMLKILRNMAMALLVAKQAEKKNNQKSENTGNENEGYLAKMYHAYDSASQLLHFFSKRLPLSVIKLESGEFACVVTGKKIVTITCGDYIGVTNGCHYHQWKFDNYNPTQLDESEKIQNYCLLLPMPIDTGLPTSDKDPIFTMIESEWMELIPDRTFQLPTFKLND